MTQDRARTRLGRAMEWWGGVIRPPLPDGEVYMADVPAQMLDLPWWKLIGGRLLLTNRRLIYLPVVPRVLPRRLLAPPRVDLEFRGIESVEATRGLVQAILRSAPGRDILDVQTTGGRKLRFQVYDAASLKDHIIASAVK